MHEQRTAGAVALDVHGGVLDAGVLVGAHLAAGRRSTRPLYEPHWVNRPYAKAWRNRSKTPRDARAPTCSRALPQAAARSGVRSDRAAGLQCAGRGAEGGP
ncbi:hypothetical protein GCM10027068_51370 [Prescottella soli]